MDYEISRVIWKRLNEGFGAEDIAVIDGLDVESVRTTVRQFRSQGKLPQMYGRAKKKWRAKLGVEAA